MIQREMPHNTKGAHAEFDTWTGRLRGKPARNSFIGDTDPVQLEKVMVRRDEAVDRFVKLKPWCREYADELRARKRSTFSFLKDSWAVVVAETSG